MDLIQIVTLALVQGLTEFLPVSSSAHLILVPLLSNWEDQGLAFDVAVHLGTLIAVVVYFWGELSVMFEGWVLSVRSRQMNKEARLAWGVLLGTIPVGLCGLIFKDFIEENLRSSLVIAVTTIVFGLALGGADWLGNKRHDEHALGWGDILLIGCAQALALIPGTSRSGITMTAALMLGFTRDGAARFSFLLSIPVITLAGGLLALDLIQQPNAVVWSELLIGTVIAAVSAWACIHYFLKLLNHVGMWPFVAYRLFLGAGLLILFV